MEAEARKRKERLAALRAAKESADAAAAAAAAGDAEPAVDAAAEGGNNRKRPHEDDGAESEGDGSTAGTTPHLKFRNYTPQNEQLKPFVEPKPELPTVEEEVKKFAPSKDELAKAHEVDLLNLAPKKPNWDLKRDLARKLAPLEKVTKRAIAELIRERILSESDSAGQLGATMAAQQELTAGDESD